jgi:hypothetical protein
MVDYSKWYWRVVRRLAVVTAAAATPVLASWLKLGIDAGIWDVPNLLAGLGAALAAGVIAALEKWVRDHNAE